MAIRENYEVDDIQTLVYSLLLHLAGDTSPWTSWEVIRGFPDVDVFDQFSKPFLYVLMPTTNYAYRHQGGKVGNKMWSLLIGAWDDRKTGGPEEIAIISSRMLGLFGDPQTAHTTTFNCTLGTTTYTNTTLIAQGLRITAVRGPRELFAENIKEFRAEFELELRT